MNASLRKCSGWVAGQRRRVVAASIIAYWLCSGTSQAFSRTAEDLEYTVKLAFLYNFTKFIEWPTGSYRDPTAPHTICIVGRDPFSSDIEGDLRTRLVGKHPYLPLKTAKPTRL